MNKVIPIHPDINDSEVAIVDMVETELYKKEFLVSWVLGSYCTYSCSYCPEKYHDGKAAYHPTDIVQRILKSLPTNSNVLFTGGEPTFHPDFEKIILEKPDHVEISVISNGSRPYAFWERVAAKFKLVLLTYHIEHAIYDRFLQTAKLIYQENNNPGFVHLVMIPKRWDDCVNVYNMLSSEGIKVIAKPVIENFGFAATSISNLYTQEQLVWISEHDDTEIVTTMALKDKDTKTLYEVSVAKLLTHKQTDFYNWECHAPLERLYINMDGRVFDTACGQRKCLGNIYQGFDLPDKPMICKQHFCWCQSDIMAKKVK